MVGGASAAFLVPVSIAAGALTLTIVPWAIRFPQITVLFLAGGLIAGQLVRLPLPGQGGGLLVTDLTVGLALLVALWRYVMHPNVPRPLVRSAGLALLPFIIWSAYTLLLHLPDYSPAAQLIGAAYWVRLTAHLLLFLAILLLAASRLVQPFMVRTLIGTTLVLALLGWAQWVIYPDLVTLPWLPAGWDPHVGRLTSTWLDPNLFGAYLALAGPVTLVFLYRSHPAFGAVGAVVIGGALFATTSRSTWLALVASALAVSPLLVTRLAAGRVRFPLGLLAVGSLLVVTLASLTLGSRAAGLLKGDETFHLRARALAAAWPLAEAHPLVGVGYNFYQFAAREAGLVSDFTVHSRAGTDNSLLTLFITTGLPGVGLALLPLATLATAYLNRWLAHHDAVALAALLGLAALFIHAQFVNSLLYAHLLITLVFVAAATLRS